MNALLCIILVLGIILMVLAYCLARIADKPQPTPQCNGQIRKAAQAERTVAACIKVDNK